MPTTIKIKNGSGAPTSSDLVQGELAIDLTNKRLYTEDGSANILELGTSPSTIDINAGTIDGVTLGTNSAVTEAQIDNININGNTIISTDTNGNIAITPNGTGEVDISKVDINGGTIDGTTIGGSTAAAGTFTTIAGTQFSSDATDVELKYSGSTKLATTNTGIDVTGTVTADGLTVDGASVFNQAASDQSGGAAIKANGTAYGTNKSIHAYMDTTNDAKSLIFAENGSSSGAVFNVAGNGDISFYEDTGTTPKLFWDASAERLGIGTTSAEGVLHLVVSSDTADIKLESSGGSGKKWTIASRTDGALQFYDSTGASEAMRIDSSGNLLVGTTSSFTNTQLMVRNASDNAGIGIATGSTGKTARLRFFDSSGNQDATIGIEGTGDALFFTTVGGGESMRIDSSGNVGIGTTLTSSAKLVVVGSGSSNSIMTNPAASLTGGTNACYIGDDGTDVLIGVGNSGTSLSLLSRVAGVYSKTLTVGSNGKVGIGTTGPGEKLDVVGNINCGNGPSGSVTINASSGTGAALFNILGGGSGNPGWDIGTYSTPTALTFGYTISGSRTERMRIDASGNLLVGGTATPTSSAKNIVLYNGTAPTGNATDGVILYAEDVSASSELKVRDEAGNVTTLSPHNFDLIPEGPSEDMAWSYYSERDGKRINVDMLKAIRLLEQLTGEKLVHTN